MRTWKLISLEMDIPGALIGRYFEQELGMKIKRKEYRIKEVNYENKKRVCSMVSNSVGNSLERKLALMGGGILPPLHIRTVQACRQVQRRIRIRPLRP